MGQMLSLGYVGVNSTNLGAWKNYASQLMGAQIVDESPDGLKLRFDDKDHRFIISKADSDGAAFFGWDVGSDKNLAEICARFDEQKIKYEPLGSDTARRRSVLELVRVEDPCGNQLELFFGHRSGQHFSPSREMLGGFVMREEVGMGHILLTTTRIDEMLTFYHGLGFRTSDRIFMNAFGVFAHFLHCNKRQHSLALLPAPEDGLHHVMLEVEEMRDVGTAYDIAQNLQMEISMTMGQHTNDKVTSFYTRSPGGFDIEIGQGGLLIENSDDWRVKEFDDISFWGHRGGVRNIDAV